MRNGDVYKIQGMAKSGVSESDIVHHFRNRYEADEVRKFLPVKAKASRRKAAAKPKDTTE